MYIYIYTGVDSDSVLLKNLCPHVTIFARVSPAQKETIVLALNDSGLYTLMCGDGTNDVGALKAAHVGVSIVNDPEFEKRIEEARDPTITTTVYIYMRIDRYVYICIFIQNCIHKYIYVYI
jgi:magnesium-transporting ATPase (P-type)